MILKTQYLNDRRPTIVSETPRAADVAAAVCSINWNQFAFVTLFQDEDNWLDGSGSLDPSDGLSMMLSVDGIQYVTETAPPTPDSMLLIFNAYLDGDAPSLFGLIYDAAERGLSDADVDNLRREDETAQRC